MTELLINDWGALALPAAASILCFGTALAISGLVLLNKGAKANLTWILVALSFICFGVVEGDRVLVSLGLPNIGAATDILRTLGSFSAFVAVLYMRRLFKGLLK